MWYLQTSVWTEAATWMNRIEGLQQERQTTQPPQEQSVLWVRVTTCRQHATWLHEETVHHCSESTGRLMPTRWSGLGTKNRPAVQHTTMLRCVWLVGFADQHTREGIRNVAWQDTSSIGCASTLHWRQQHYHSQQVVHISYLWFDTDCKANYVRPARRRLTGTFQVNHCYRLTPDAKVHIRNGKWQMPRHSVIVQDGTVVIRNEKGYPQTLSFSCTEQLKLVHPGLQHTVLIVYQFGQPS